MIGLLLRRQAGRQAPAPGVGLLRHGMAGGGQTSGRLLAAQRQKGGGGQRLGLSVDVCRHLRGMGTDARWAGNVVPEGNEQILLPGVLAVFDLPRPLGGRQHRFQVARRAPGLNQRGQAIIGPHLGGKIQAVGGHRLAGHLPADGLQVGVLLHRPQLGLHHRLLPAVHGLGSGGGHRKLHIGRDGLCYLGGQPAQGTEVDAELIADGHGNRQAPNRSKRRNSTRRGSGSPLWCGRSRARVR